MPVDFRASQLQTNKIIASGSTGTATNALLLIYPISKQAAGTPNQGIINTGSAFSLSGIGSDVFMYVSGGIGQKGVSASNSITVFGGDLHVSGNFTYQGAAPFATASFFRLGVVDYASTLSTASQPEVIGQVVFSANEFSGTLTLRGMLSSTGLATTASVKFWNLTSGAYVDIAGVGQSTLSVVGPTPVLTTSVNLIGASGFNTSSQHVYELQLFTSTGSATAYAGGWELRPSGSFSGLTNTITTSSLTVISGNWTEGTPSPRLKTTASVAIHTSFAEEMGADVWFFVSGTLISGSAASRNTIFGGTVITSGNLGFRNAAIPPGRGAISLNAQGDLIFSDGNSPQGWSLTQLATSGSDVVATSFFFSNTANLVETTGSLRVTSSLGWDATTFISRSAGNMLFFDTTVPGGYTLKQLAALSDQTGSFIRLTGSTTDATPLLIWSYDIGSNHLVDIDCTVLAVGTGSGITKRLKRNIAVMNYSSTGSFLENTVFVPVLDLSGSAAASGLDVGFLTTGSQLRTYVTGAASQAINWVLRAEITSGSN